MKTLRKRALAKTVGKRFVSDRKGGFDIIDSYGSVGYAFKVDDRFIVELITLRPAYGKIKSEGF